MKNKLIVSSLALCALVAAASFAALPGSGQSAGRAAMTHASSTQAETPASSVVPTAAIREAGAVEPAAASAFIAAASRNLTLRDTLPWAFGGKQQRGWYLYLPLMAEMLNTKADAASPEFASALSRWQKTAGLAATGILDDETLYRMVSAWQGARMKDRGYPDSSELVTAPPSDFWDPSRPDELRRVRRDAYAAYKRMVAAAAAATMRL